MRFDAHELLGIVFSESIFGLEPPNRFAGRFSVSVLELRKDPVMTAVQIVMAYLFPRSACCPRIEFVRVTTLSAEICTWASRVDVCAARDRGGGPPRHSSGEAAGTSVSRNTDIVRPPL